MYILLVVTSAQINLPLEVRHPALQEVAIARWDGNAFSPVTDTARRGMNDHVRALRVLDEDGDGPLSTALYAGGGFVSAGGLNANIVAQSFAKYTEEKRAGGIRPDTT